MNHLHSWQRELVTVFQALLLGLIVTAYVLVCSSLSSRAFSVDFIQFFASAQSLRAGDSLYKPLQFDVFDPTSAETGARPAEIHPNLNPPLTALVVAPLTFVGLASGYLVWTARRAPGAAALFTRRVLDRTQQVTDAEIGARLDHLRAVFDAVQLFVAPSASVADAHERLGLHRSKLLLSDYGFVPWSPATRHSVAPRHSPTCYSWVWLG